MPMMHATQGTAASAWIQRAAVQPVAHGRSAPPRQNTRGSQPSAPSRPCQQETRTGKGTKSARKSSHRRGRCAGKEVRKRTRARPRPSGSARRDRTRRQEQRVQTELPEPRPVGRRPRPGRRLIQLAEGAEQGQATKTISARRRVRAKRSSSGPGGAGHSGRS